MPSEIVRLFKGINSRRLKKGFADASHPCCIRRQYWGKLGMLYAVATLWAEGYPVGTAGQVSAETIKRYIEESQKE